MSAVRIWPRRWRRPGRFSRALPGIAQVDVLDDQAGAKLLEPWLGTRSLEGLPVPRLIRVVADTASPPDLVELEKALGEVKGVRLDTHRKWEAELTRMARALSLLSYAILALISLSAVAIVVFATRAVLQANRHIVDLLHLVGARDSYIARQIDGRFVRTGLLSGFIGVAMGLLTFLLLGLAGSDGGGGFAAASRGLLFAPPDVAVWSYGALIAVPVAATLICLITSRITLMRRLGCHDMIYIRSALFNVIFYVNLALVSGFGIVVLFHAPQVVDQGASGVGALLDLLAAGDRRDQDGGAGPGSDSKGCLSGGGQAPVLLGDLCHPAIARRSCNGPEEGTHIHPLLRMVHLQVPDDPR